ncbi:hypothetical protein [Kordiimonas sp. SCSIO 12610]|uniref:hypothetical protein n=1 Tax=Kordiimonas sp. SCSIO 12610 TaxID=2829597 RepID=UPI00210C8700|nr:hypothetical protein [Kordiimonas sp. SCSIO 12610]UTW56096.1 hypothetical protein KFF44_04160 [Kordiimonas sp. SCSIO 12610]
MANSSNRYGITLIVWGVNYILAGALVIIEPSKLAYSLGIVLGLPVLFLVLRYPFYSLTKKLSASLYNKNGPKPSEESIASQRHKIRSMITTSVFSLVGLCLIPFSVGEIAYALDWVNLNDKKDIVARLAGITYGLVIIYLGNKSPKMIDNADIAINSPTWTREIAKLAGYIAIILGTLVVLDFLLFERKQAALIMMALLSIGAVIFFGRFSVLYMRRRKELRSNAVSKPLQEM